ncbi:MAG: DUF362 domain-containing protein [Thermoanaerobaculales bacterium]
MATTPKETNDYAAVSRRRLLGTWGPAVLAGLALGGAGLTLHERPGRHRPPRPEDAPPLDDWRTADGNPGLAIAGGSGPAENLRRALAAMGGIEFFVKPGEKVAIKPNCAWDRRPQQAANTDPTVVAELVRSCLAAGAASVIVVDNTCHDPGRAFERSGIAAAVAEAGGSIAHQNSVGTEVRNLGGSILGSWEVLRPLVEADRVVNVPVVKHHSLSRATVGMKNWIGAIVGRRANLHQRLAQACAELGHAFRPTLTIVDATRILTGGGPTGGSLALVRATDLVAVCTDPVAADAWGASLLGIEPHELAHLAIAKRLGLGTTEWRSVEVEV